MAVGPQPGRWRSVLEMETDRDADEEERVVALADFGDEFTADLVVAKLRAFGIHAQAQSARASGGVRLPAGNIVWVFERDLDDAREIVSSD
jgi:hypothetical protein